MTEPATAAPLIPAQPDKEVVRARKLGRHAGLSGEPLTACPYNASGSGRQMVLAVNWCRAYRAVTPGSVSYEDDSQEGGDGE